MGTQLQFLNANAQKVNNILPTTGTHTNLFFRMAKPAISSQTHTELQSGSEQQINKYHDTALD
jgi:hypothetical protein